MAIVLVTGMSGTGKSTVLAELARRGHAVVDTDYGNYIEAVLLPDQAEAEPLWHEERMRALLDGHTGGHLFIAGTVANQGSFYSRLDAVVLLSAPLDVLLQRIESRTTNDFGKSKAERDRIVRDVTAVEPLIRRRATLEIDTSGPLQGVLEAVLAVANSAAVVVHPTEANCHEATESGDCGVETACRLIPTSSSGCRTEPRVGTGNEDDGSC